VQLFDYDFEKNTEGVDDTEIRQILLYFSKPDCEEFKKLSKKAMISIYGNEAPEKGNISDMLLDLLRNSFSTIKAETIPITVDQAHDILAEVHVDELNNDICANDFTASNLPPECAHCTYPICINCLDVCLVTGEAVVRPEDSPQKIEPFNNMPYDRKSNRKKTNDRSTGGVSQNLLFE